MSTKHGTNQKGSHDSTNPRPSYIHLGVDSTGAHHVHRTADDTIFVIADGRIEARFELGDKSYRDYRKFVDETREWRRFHPSRPARIENPLRPLRCKGER